MNKKNKKLIERFDLNLFNPSTQETVMTHPTEEEFKEARRVIQEYYDSPGVKDDPFADLDKLKSPNVKYVSMNPKAVAKVHDLLSRMHSCYNFIDEGGADNQAQLYEIIEQMHSLLDDAMDVVRYASMVSLITGKVDEWEQDYNEDEVKPDYLTE